MISFQFSPLSTTKIERRACHHVSKSYRLEKSSGHVMLFASQTSGKLALV